MYTELENLKKQLEDLADSYTEEQLDDYSMCGSLDSAFYEGVRKGECLLAKKILNYLERTGY